MAPPRKGEFDVGGKPAAWVRDGVVADRPVVVLAHGAGAPMTHPFMAATAEGLVQRGFSVVRFQFPYMVMRSRTGSRRPPDRAPVLLDTWRAMLDVVSRWKSAGPIAVAGKSMGGRMASMLLADGRAPEVRAAVYLGYPLHPPGNKAKLRKDHLPSVPVPQLFVSGSRDSLCDLDILRPVVKKLGKDAHLFVVEGGDHSLATSRKEPLAGADAWLDAIREFVNGATE